MTYHAKLMAGGKVVIPADLRRELGLDAGDYLVFERENGGIVMKSYRQIVRELQEEVAKHVPPGVSLADELIADRRAENAREEEETRQWPARR